MAHHLHLPLGRRPAAAAALCGLWVAALSLLHARVWHPGELLLRQLPLVPADLLAAVLVLAAGGVRDLAALALLGLGAFGAGTLLCRLVAPGLDAPRRRSLAPALGLGFWGLFTLGLGLLGGYRPAGSAAALVLLALAAGAGAIEAVRALREPAAAGPREPLRALFLACAAPVAVFLFAKALRPAVFYDAITYHLGVPNYYLQEGGIGYLPFDAMANNPFLAEMVSTLGMLLFGVRVAQLTGVLVLLLAALAVRDLSRELCPGMDPHLPALFFLATPAFLEVSILCTNDLLLACFLLLALRCLLLWKDGAGGRLAALGGVFGGLALGTKYLALGVLPLVAACGLWPDPPGGRSAWRASAAALGAFAAAALLVWSPWPLQNAVHTGDPVYPLLYGLFGARDMAPPQYANIVAPVNLAGALAGLVQHPWRLFLSPPGAQNDRYGAASYLGPLLLLLVPTLALARGVPPRLKAALACAAALYVLWALTSPQARYLYPALALLTVAAGWAAWSLVRWAPRAVGLPVALVVAFFVLADLCLGFRQVDRWTSAAGFDHLRESDAEHLARRVLEKGGSTLAAAPLEMAATDALPGDARVLIVGDAQHLYLRRRHLYAYLSATTPLAAFEAGADPAAVAAQLRREGVTHVLYNPRELARLQRSGVIALRPEGQAAVEAFLRSPAARLVASTPGGGWPVSLFELAGAR